MNDEELSLTSGPPITSLDNYSWQVIPTQTTFSTVDSSRENLQTQIYELTSKNYSLECQNKMLMDRINYLEQHIFGLLSKVDEMEQVIIKMYEKYALNNED
ncbi:hypothetical protein [Lachnospira sp.]|jgi:uncharacterized protein YaaN involved in tellurite resistance|uniref:hypothetical protein n=1 Tax=Lachnospira sp. TaxID=2049031 RepID=UPI00257E8DB6|nr:hypothetical protein [Lachnospira sp.]